MAIIYVNAQEGTQFHVIRNVFVPLNITYAKFLRDQLPKTQNNFSKEEALNILAKVKFRASVASCLVRSELFLVLSLSLLGIGILLPAKKMPLKIAKSAFLALGSFLLAWTVFKYQKGELQKFSLSYRAIVQRANRDASTIQNQQNWEKFTFLISK